MIVVGYRASPFWWAQQREYVLFDVAEMHITNAQMVEKVFAEAKPSFCSSIMQPIPLLMRLRTKGKSWTKRTMWLGPKMLQKQQKAMEQPVYISIRLQVFDARLSVRSEGWWPAGSTDWVWSYQAHGWGAGWEIFVVSILSVLPNLCTMVKTLLLTYANLLRRTKLWL